MGVVPLLIFFNEASIDTFLDLAVDFFNLFPWSWIGTTPHSRLFKFRFQFQVHLDQFFTREGRRQGAEHLLIGYQQFLQWGVRLRLSSFCWKSCSAWRLLFPCSFFFCRSAVSAGTEPSSHSGGHCCPLCREYTSGISGSGSV